MPTRPIPFRLLICCLLPLCLSAARADSPPPLPFDSPNYTPAPPPSADPAPAPAARVERDEPAESVRCTKKTVRVGHKRKTVSQCAPVKPKATAKTAAGKAATKAGSRKTKPVAGAKAKTGTKKPATPPRKKRK